MVVLTGSSNLQKGPNLGRKIVVVITRRSYKRGGRKTGMFHCLYSNAGSDNYLYIEGRTIKTLWEKCKKSCKEKLVIGHSLFFRGRAMGQGKKRRRNFADRMISGLKNPCHSKIPPPPTLRSGGPSSLFGLGD